MSVHICIYNLNPEAATGKSTLGLINPLLYAALEQGIGLFNDITDGLGFRV
jgi:hypothetical protein